MSVTKELYKLPKDIVIKRRGDKFLLISPSRPDWVVTNSNGTKVLKLCNCNRTLDDITKIISKLTGRDTKIELISFFNEISLQSPRFLAPITEGCDIHPYNLRIVHLNLTNECNLKCIYCYADERSDSKGRLNHKDFLNIIDSINNISKNVQIVLTGGESLLKSYALNVAEYAKKKGNQVHILSNGLLISELNVKQISEVTDLIKISLDGSTSEINDFHRGKGTFYKISKAIDLLVQYNAPLQVSMTVTKKNINNIELMTQKYGSLLTFAPLFKAGRAKINKGLAITGKEYYDALHSAKGVNPLSCLCSSLDSSKKQKIVKCAIGDAEISISDTGDIYPCHLLHLPQFLAGNVKKESLESIYEHSEKLKAIRELTVSEIKGCKRCDIRFICGGACRARAFFEKGKINVCDNFCEYEKQAYINGLFELYQF